MPHTKNSRFDVSAVMKARKKARQKAVEQCRSLKVELSSNTRKINTLKSKVSWLVSEDIHLFIELY